MARTGTTVKPVACLVLASLVSFTLLSLLLQSSDNAKFGGDQLLSVSLFPASDSLGPDPAQIAEPLSLAMADSQDERGAVQTGPDELGSDAYLPAFKLTEKPQVVVDIDAEWRLPGVDLPVLVALLLINEYGDVDRVELNQASLLSMLEEDIRSRFLAMKFTPGSLHGRPVKSALRIEIRLE
jgi:hypothetical protein